MKIKRIVLVYSIICGIILLAGAYFFSKENKKSIDIPECNMVINEVALNYSPDFDKSEYEKKYECTILLTWENDYKRRLYSYINEGAYIYDIFVADELVGKAVFNVGYDAYAKMKAAIWIKITVVAAVLIISSFILIFYLYRRIIKPFDKMQRFAANVAKGNLDVAIPMLKNNYFGAFTESFDIMREELKSAREKEKQANQSKKELVAGLSHDIKTPLATIRANCELMEMLKTYSEEKIHVIDSKAKMVEQLVNNLFNSTLEELEVIKIEPREESSLLILDMIDEVKEYGSVIIMNEIPSCLLWMDRLRFSQVIDNVVNNSFKYAGTPVEICFEDREDGIIIRISDSGPGVDDADLALISGKFYRGKNADGITGTGLGLYLVGLFMSGMEGGFEFYNDNGFVVELFVKKA